MAVPLALAAGVGGSGAAAGGAGAGAAGSSPWLQMLPQLLAGQGGEGEDKAAEEDPEILRQKLNAIRMKNSGSGTGRPHIWTLLGQV